MFSARNLEGELLAEVDFSGYRIAGDLAARARHENLALVQDVGAIGDRERLTHVVVGDQDADAPVAQAPDDLLDVADGDGVDAGERLVEQQVLRRGHQRAGDLQPAPLAARQGEGRVRGERGQVQLRQQLARARELLAELDLTALAPYPAFTLSGGERRRLEITRALVTSPQYLLLDEPFTGIDPIAIGDIQEIIGRLRDRGIGILITDHNVRETLAITDRAYILYEGKILVPGKLRYDATPSNQRVKHHAQKET